MTEVNVYAYPPEVPPCQDRASERFGQTCLGCPYAPTCGYLAVSRELIHKNSDHVIPGFFNLNGIEAIIEQDKAVAHDLTDGRAGLLEVDIRGIKFGNDVYGEYFGDAIIREGGLRLLSDCIRAYEGTDEIEERRSGWHPGKLDVGFRGGRSDELFALVRDVTPEQLHKIAERSQEHFSISHALQDCQQGKAPIPGNVSYTHATDVPEAAQTSALAMFAAMRHIVDENTIISKRSQYDEMWRVISASTSDNIARPTDDRLIYQHFVEAFCPDIASRIGII